MSKEISIDEGYKKGRVKGWGRCERCGLSVSFALPKAIKAHVEGSGCKEFRQMFGLPKNHKFDPSKTNYYIGK